MKDSKCTEDRQNVAVNTLLSYHRIICWWRGIPLGLEKAGLQSILLNDNDRHACHTLTHNRPHWNIVCQDSGLVDFTPYRGNIDVVAGGFPSQAFGYAGKKRGINDARGTLFFEFARAIQETSLLICVGENVRGLSKNDPLRNSALVFS